MNGGTQRTKMKIFRTKGKLYYGEKDRSVDGRSHRDVVGVG